MKEGGGEIGDKDLGKRGREVSKMEEGGRRAQG